MSYICPLCHKPLMQTERNFYCEQNHHFDIAKEGYVNLLPVQHKASKDPGDNKVMMQARRDFLSFGYYQALKETINALLNEYLPKENSKILDIGCGEGYYTSSFSRENWQVYGLDISKEMIRAASKSYKKCHFAVASSQRLPFKDQSLDAVICIYAPCNEQELSRVVKNSGFVLTVTPAARHLYQLKKLIYPEALLHQENNKEITNFLQQTNKHLSYSMNLTGEHAAALLQMTPFAWRASQTVKTELAKRERFECEADFLLSLYQKTED